MKTYSPNTGTMNMFDKDGNFLQTITTDGERFVTLEDHQLAVKVEVDLINVLKDKLNNAYPEVGVIFPDKSERHDVSKDIVDTNHKDYFG